MSNQPRVLAYEQLTDYAEITHLLTTIIENGVAKVRRAPRAQFEAALQATVRDGREIELGVSTTHIRWRYVGTSTWINLISLSSLIGPPGPPGPAGQAGTIPVFSSLPPDPNLGQQCIVGGVLYVCLTMGIWSRVPAIEIINSPLIATMLTDNPLWMFSLKELSSSTSIAETIANQQITKPGWLSLNQSGSSINTRMARTNTNPGSNGVLIMPEENSPDTAWTVEAVVQPEATTPFVGNGQYSLTSGDHKNLIGSVQGGSGRRAAMLQVGTNGIAVGEHGPSFASQRLAFAVQINQRSHVALTLNDSVYRIYLNGVEVASGPSTVANVAIPNTLAGRFFGSYQGYLSDLAAYNYALSPARILAHAQAAGV